MEALLRALKPARRRIRRNRLLRGAASGLALGAAAAAVLLALSRRIMIPDAKIWAGAGWLAAVLLCAAGNALRKVTSREAAVRADRCGLQERAVTALEALPGDALDERTRAMREAQAADACAALERLDPKEIRPGSVRKRLLAACAGGVLCAALVLIPNAMDRRAEEFKALRVTLDRLAAEAEEAEKQDGGGRTEAEKQELRRLTEDLKRDFRESRDAADALVAVDRAEKRLEEMRQTTAGEARDAAEAARALAEALGGAGLDALAQALEGGDEQALANALAGMDAAAADALSEAAEGLEGAAKEAAENLASAGQGGDPRQAASEAMQSLQSARAGGSMGASAMSQALRNMKAALGAGSQAAGNQPGGGSAQMPGEGNSGGQGGGGAGMGEGDGNNRNGAGSAGAGPSGGKADPRYKETAWEQIYDPEQAGAGYRDVTTEQQRLDGESVQIQAGEGRGALEGSVPYGRVVGEYARTETQSADSENLTAEQREWVREYYRLLTEQQ